MPHDCRGARTNLQHREPYGDTLYLGCGDEGTGDYRNVHSYRDQWVQRARRAGSKPEY